MGNWLTKLVLRTFVTVVTSLGVNVAATLINGVIDQYVCKMRQVVRRSGFRKQEQETGGSLLVQHRNAAERF